MTDLVVAGAGMAGLVAAARARELGAEVEVHEKGARIGGSMLLSSGVVWRYRDFETFREQCPGGDASLQRVVHDEVDDALDWLVGLGAVVTKDGTDNPLTVGRRFDTRELCSALLQLNPSLRIAAPVVELPDAPLLLATGGFQASASLVRGWITPEAESLLLRSNGGSAGDGLRLGSGAGGALTGGMDEFYGRAMPAAEFVHESHWVRAAQLYARWASRIEGGDGAVYDGEIDWAEVNVVRWIAARPGARAWFVVPRDALERPTVYGTVAELIERARQLGASVNDSDEGVRVEVRAAITQTLGGLRVDPGGRVVDADGSAVSGPGGHGIWAAGGDVGGVATGGYFSNLAAALVIGKRAAESALA